MLKAVGNYLCTFYRYALDDIHDFFKVAKNNVPHPTFNLCYLGLN